jgi:hypothetical protein
LLGQLLLGHGLPVQHRKLAASADSVKKFWPVRTAAAPSTTLLIVEKKPRREEWATNRSLIRLMIESMDSLLSLETLWNALRASK